MYLICTNHTQPTEAELAQLLNHAVSFGTLAQPRQSWQVHATCSALIMAERIAKWIADDIQKPVTIRYGCMNGTHFEHKTVPHTEVTPVEGWETIDTTPEETPEKYDGVPADTL